MAFLGSTGGFTQDDDSILSEINITPLVDVMLVLLIIFMVTAPMLSQGIKVDLPQAAAEPIEPDDLEPLLLLSLIHI